MPVFNDSVASLADQYWTELTRLAQHPEHPLDAVTDATLVEQLSVMFGREGLAEQRMRVVSTRGQQQWKSVGLALATCEAVLLHAHRVQRIGYLLFKAAQLDPSEDNHLAFAEGLISGQVCRLWPLRGPWTELLGPDADLDCWFATGMIAEHEWTSAYAVLYPLALAAGRPPLDSDLVAAVTEALADGLPVELAAVVCVALDKDVRGAVVYDMPSETAQAIRTSRSVIEQAWVARVGEREWGMRLVLAAQE
jgi:hypothetical protein